MSRSKKRQRTAGQEGTASQGGDAKAVSRAGAGPSSSTSISSKRPRPSTPAQEQEQDHSSKRPRRAASPPLSTATAAQGTSAAAEDAVAAPDDASASASSASRPRNRPRLLRIQRRNLVAGPLNPGGGYSYLTLRVEGTSGSGSGIGEITPAALGDALRSTLHQHLGLVGGSVPFDVLSIDQRDGDDGNALSGIRGRRSTALVRVPLQYAREVRAALVLGGAGGRASLRLGLEGSQEETGSVWTLRARVTGGDGGGSAWMRRLEEKLLT